MTVYGLIFYCDYYHFLCFPCQDANMPTSNCVVSLQFVKETQIGTTNSKLSGVNYFFWSYLLKDTRAS